MNKRLLSILALSVLVGLTGCSSSSSSSSSSTSASSTTPGLKVTNISGGTTAIEGVWKGTCYSSAKAGSIDWKDTFTFTGTSFVVKVSAYTSTDLSCTGTVSEAGTISADMTKGTDEAITSWVNTAKAAVTAPMAKDASGLISVTATFTKVDAKITAATGTFGTGGANAVTIGQVTDFSAVMDATGTVPVAYGINYKSGASTGITDDFSTKQ